MNIKLKEIKTNKVNLTEEQKLNKAKLLYGIDVPSDEVFYSEEYQEYFGLSKQDERKSKTIVSHLEKYRDFNTMYLKCMYVTVKKTLDDAEKRGLTVTNSEAVVFGGQAGAGKTRSCRCC